MTLGDQVSLVQKELMCLAPGYRFVRSDNAMAAAEYVAMLNTNQNLGSDSTIGKSAFDGIKLRAIIQSLKRHVTAHRTSAAVRSPRIRGAARRLQENE